MLITNPPNIKKKQTTHIIHAINKRSDFIQLNCKTLTEKNVETRLCDDPSDSISGRREKSCFNTATGSTLFLENADALPLIGQQLLYAAVKRQQYRPLGEDVPRAVEFRLITASSRDLKQLIDSGEFLRELYELLNALPMTIPPLRERPKNIMTLLKYFRMSRIKKVSRRTMELLHSHQWPYNIRELRDLLKQVFLLIDPPLSTQKFEKNIEKLLKTDRADQPAILPLTELQQQHIKRALRFADDDVDKAARLLGVARRWLAKRVGAAGRDESLDWTRRAGTI